jgi:hypothetical protein
VLWRAKEGMPTPVQCKQINGEENSMETGLWALNLLAVVYLCFWALREDSPKKQMPAKK